MPTFLNDFLLFVVCQNIANPHTMHHRVLFVQSTTIFFRSSFCRCVKHWPTLRFFTRFDTAHLALDTSITLSLTFSFTHSLFLFFLSIYRLSNANKFVLELWSNLKTGSPLASLLNVSSVSSSCIEYLIDTLLILLNINNQKLNKVNR